MKRKDPANWIVPAVLGAGVLAAGSAAVVLNQHRVRSEYRSALHVVAPSAPSSSEPPTPPTAPLPPPRVPDDDAIRVSHLLVMYQGSARATPSITRSKPEARRRAEAALNRVLSGSDFAAVVREFSDEPGASQRGGDLGRVTRGMTVPSFEQPAFALSPGQTSGVIETEFGFHIIRRWPDGAVVENGVVRQAAER